MTIFGSLNKHAFPTGFGPGTYATFHRILELGYAVLWRFNPIDSTIFFSVPVISLFKCLCYLFIIL